MKHPTKLFLDVIKESMLDLNDESLSKEFEKGINETINVIKQWFESNNVKYIEVYPKEYL